MRITEVRIKLMPVNDERLQAFCSVTFDNAFVVRDLKLIEGLNGYFLAMPSRKLMDRCPQCRYKNHLMARFCNQCGSQLEGNRALHGPDGHLNLFADVAHPSTAGCRAMIQAAVLRAYDRETERARQPGSVSRYDFGNDGIDTAPTDDLGNEAARTTP